MTVIVAPDLMRTNYRDLSGKSLHLPDDPTYGPSIEGLNIHRSETDL